jgi:CheY-like chemotaxis protein
MAKILVIDDVAGVRASVVNTLKRAGHEVFEAANGTDGLAIARAHAPDLVITDILMPEMDGLETIDLIRREGRGRRPRFLAISGGGSLVATDDALKAASLHADAVLAKPFLGAELTAQVSKILEA